MKTDYCTLCQCSDPTYTLQTSTSQFTASCISEYINDGFCDEQNNNANCNYDGGDCCGDIDYTDFCTVCQCLDPTYTTTTPQSTLQTSNTQFTTILASVSSGCFNPDYQGDDSCDDENNNANCEYDGGDCCGDHVETLFCTECQCLDPTYISTTPQSTLQTSNTQTTTASSSGCYYPHRKGDGYCDDENNNADCEYDGGDCCGDNVITYACTLCQCLDPTYATCNPNYQNDGSCDDENNNANCEYDGGDCCGENVDTTYCTLCQCLDPQSTMQTSDTQTTTPLMSECDNLDYQDDGSCDDENNNADCEYDGGDCCGENVDTTWCTLCQCLDPTYTTTPISATTS